MVSYFFLYFRNSPVHCKTLEFEKMNLNLWKTDSPALQVPESVLLLTLEKGSQSLAARRKAEYEISKTFYSIFLKLKSRACFFFSLPLPKS